MHCTMCQNRISCATLRCESLNTKNVTLQILQWDITTENCIISYRPPLTYQQMLHRNGPGSCALYLLIWGAVQHCVYETRIHDIDDLCRNAWCKLASTWTGRYRPYDWPVHEIVCACMVADTLKLSCWNTWSETNIHLYDTSEHFTKPSV